MTRAPRCHGRRMRTINFQTAGASAISSPANAAGHLWTSSAPLNMAATPGASAGASASVGEEYVGSNLRTLVLASLGAQSNLLAIHETGMMSWGDGKHGKLGQGAAVDEPTPDVMGPMKGQTFLSVSTGDSHALAVASDGAIYSWGRGANGRLGHGDNLRLCIPKIITTVQQAYQVTMVSAGHAHSLALTSDGVVLSWGSGAGGRLGLGDDDDRSIPSMVNGMSPVDIVSAGFDFTVAVCRSNKAVDEGTKVEPEIYVWGCGKDGRLGMGSEDTYFSPVTLTTAHGTGMEGVAVVSSGWRHSVLLDEMGQVFTWGGGGNCSALGRAEVQFKGELRLGQEAPQNLQESTPHKISVSAVPVVDISSGHNHVLALDEDGEVFVWGFGANGRLGLGNEDEHFTPQHLSSLEGQQIDCIAAGLSHSLAVTKDKETVYIWGCGEENRLGFDGEFADVLVPTPVECDED